MVITNDFNYFKPKTLEEAIALLSKYEKKAKILAGGTDLIVTLKDGGEIPEIIIDIKGIEELQKIKFEAGKLFIGADITFSDLIESDVIREKFPLLEKASKTVASIGIRNRATIVGNICSAVPSADSAPALLVYNAEILVQNAERKRKIPISEWFKGPKKTALSDDEIVVGISVSFPEKRHVGIYEKLSRYDGEDLAQAGIGILVLENWEYRIAFCAVGPIPKRSFRIEKMLNGKKATDSVIAEIKAVIPEEISPITDIRSTQEYRTHMMQIMFERGMKKAISQLSGGNYA